MWFDENSLSPDTSWSNAWLEKALRSAVRDVYREGNLEDLTVKRVRKATERLHNMSEDFFKSHTYWKQKSKDVIQSEVVGFRRANVNIPSTHRISRTLYHMSLHPPNPFPSRVPKALLQRNLK